MPSVRGCVTNTCDGEVNAAPLLLAMGLPGRTSPLPGFPTGLVPFGDSIFLSRAKIMNVIFLGAKTVFCPLPSGCCFFSVQ